MSVNNKDIALSVIHFLKQSVAKNEIPEDYSESMDVAIDCIADAFEVSKDDDAKTVEAKFGGKSLVDLLNFSANSSTKNGDTSQSKEVDADTKAKADALKAEGNKAMSIKNFNEAIEKYTEAIKLDGSNVVYLSNRAAAYSSTSQHENAVKDAEKAIELNPSFSKSYSRLGLAKYALGDATAAMKAYEKGLEVEGDKKSDAMTKGYETAKRRVEDELEKSIPQSSVATSDSDNSTARGAGAGAGTGASGMPDFGSMFGGNGGGMPSFSEMMNNPQLMQAAQSLMSDPNAMQNLMNNPAIRQMAENFGGSGGNGSGPDLSNLMNNPMLQNLASQFMGGNNSNNNNSGSNNQD